jgi:hypothetical protein
MIDERQPACKMALEAILWYNGVPNNVMSGGAANTPDRTHLKWRCIMDMIPQDNMPCKRCCRPNCETPYLPATLEFFGRDKRAKDGLKSACRKCLSAEKKAYAANHKEELKLYRANYCQEHREEISEQRKGYYQENQDHLKQYSAQYRAEHPEKVRLSSARYNATEQRRRVKARYKSSHCEEVRQYSVRYHAEHREEHRQRRARLHAERRHEELVYGRQYNATHREIRNERCRQYRRTERGRTLHRIHESKRNACKRSVRGTYAAAQIIEQLKRQRYRCYYAKCGFAKFAKAKGQYVYEIEHTYPLSRVAGADIPANDMGYLVLACPACNASKNNKFPWEWPEGGRLL